MGIADAPDDPGARHEHGIVSPHEPVVDPDEARRLAEQFKLLGDPTRMRLLYALLGAGELCVCDLAERIGVHESTASHALRLLRTSGIVRNRREGRVIHYSLEDSHVRRMLELSLEHLRHTARSTQPARGSAGGRTSR